jgi:hypothetical protein
MDKDLRKALKEGVIPLYTDTDSYIALSENGRPSSFKLSPFAGAYKDELERKTITRYYGLGSKNYTIFYLEADGETAGNIVHVRGFALGSRFSKKAVNHERVGGFAVDLIGGKAQSISVPQFTLHTQPCTRLINTRYMNKEYRNDFPMKRYIVPNSRFKLIQTLPFGFSAKMLAAAEAS